MQRTLSSPSRQPSSPSVPWTSAVCVFAAMALFCLFPTRTIYAETVTKRLAPGVTFTQEIDTKTPLIVNVVTVDLDAPGVHVGVGVGQDRVSADDPTHGRETVERLARRHQALAAINADYFPYTGDPLGVGIKDGELFSEPWVATDKIGPRMALGVGGDDNRVRFDVLGFLGDLQTADGSRARINGINRSVGTGEIVAFTELYGTRTAVWPGGTEVVLRDVNLPIRADKLIIGKVAEVRPKIANAGPIPAGGLVLGAGTGRSAEFLAQHCHPGDAIEFVLSVAPLTQEVEGVKIAALPAESRGLPSRGASGIGKSALWWSRVAHAVGGGPRLLHNGQVALDGATEGFPPSFTDMPHARTCAGTSADGRFLYLVTVDGGQSASRGVSLGQLALILRRCGASEGINLDGGGSTTMAVSGLIVNSVVGGARPVADMLMVYSDHAQAAVDVAASGSPFSRDDPPAPVVPDTAGIHIVVAPEEKPRLRISVASPVVVGAPTPVYVFDGDRLVSRDTGDVIWRGPVSDIGFVNQKGAFTAARAGNGTITAVCMGQELKIPVTAIDKAPPPVMAIDKGAPAPAGNQDKAQNQTVNIVIHGAQLNGIKIHARFTPDAQDPAHRSRLQVQVTADDGAPLKDEKVHLSAVGGTLEKADVVTTEDGDADVGVLWTEDKGGAVTASAGTAVVTVERQ